MASGILQRMLRDLCGVQGWTYSVFWRLRKRLVPRSAARTHRMRFSSDGDDWVLMWEDGYLSSIGQVAESCHSMDVFNQGSVDYGLLQAAYSKLSYQIYNCGEGLIGVSVSSQSPEWVHNEANDPGAFQFRFNTLPSGWDSHFAAGIKTITVIPVPGGAIQLGSIHSVPEDPKLANELARKFNVLQKIPGIFLSDLTSQGQAPSPPRAAGGFPLLPPNGNTFNSAWGERQHLVRNESSDSSGAAEMARMAAHQLAATTTSSATSCMTSPSQGMTNRLLRTSRSTADSPALAAFRPTEEEHQIARLQFKFLSVNGAPTASELKKVVGGSTSLHTSPPRGVKRTHHSRSVSMPLFSTQGGHVGQSVGVSSLVGQLRSAMDRRENAAKCAPANDFDFRKLMEDGTGLNSGDGLRMRVLPPSENNSGGESGLTSLNPEAELLEQLKILDQKHRMGLLSEEMVEDLLNRLESKAQRLGLIGGKEESLASPEPFSLPPAKHAQIEAEVSSGMEPGMHRALSADLEFESYLDGFDLGVELPSPRSPPAKRVNCPMTDWDAAFSGQGETLGSLNPTVADQIEELRKMIPGAEETDLASLLQRTVNYISDNSRQHHNNREASAMAARTPFCMDGTLHTLV